MGFLVGDVLVAAAFMSYVGPFLSSYREDLIKKQWLSEVIVDVDIEKKQTQTRSQTCFD